MSENENPDPRRFPRPKPRTAADDIAWGVFLGLVAAVFFLVGLFQVCGALTSVISRR